MAWEKFSYVENQGEITGRSFRTQTEQAINDIAAFSEQAIQIGIGQAAQDAAKEAAEKAADLVNKSAVLTTPQNIEPDGKTVARTNIEAYHSSGGILNGTIVAGNRDLARNITPNSYIAIFGGDTLGANDGAYLQLYGKNHAYTGSFILSAGAISGQTIMSGSWDGRLKWGEATFQNRTNDLHSMQGLSIRSNEDGKLGASIMLSANVSAEVQNQGAFAVSTGGIKGSPISLIGKPDGSLTWNGNPILVVSNQGSDFVYYPDGRLECFGRVTVQATIDNPTGSIFLSNAFSFEFPKKFIEPPVCVLQITTNSKGRGAWVYYQNTTKDGVDSIQLAKEALMKDTEPFNFNLAYIAKGRWKE